MRDFIELLKALSLFISCLVIGYGGFFYFFIREVDKTKRKTYNNIIKASKMIMKKGYEQKEAQEMALRIFENMEQLKNGMSAEWFIEKIAPKNYFMEV